MKYKVEFAEFHKIEVEANSKKEAEEKAAVMDDEDILRDSVENSGMVVWNVSEVQKMNDYEKNKNKIEEYRKRSNTWLLKKLCDLMEWANEKIKE